MNPASLTPQSVLDYGALVVFFVVVLGIVLHWYFKRYPAEQKARERRDQMLFEQVALGRQALETSNEVIRMNSAEMQDTRASHQMLDNRLGCVETLLHDHDKRAEDMAADVKVLLDR